MGHRVRRQPERRLHSISRSSLVPPRTVERRLVRPSTAVRKWVPDTLDWVRLHTAHAHGATHGQAPILSESRVRFEERSKPIGQDLRLVDRDQGSTVVDPYQLCVLEVLG